MEGEDPSTRGRDRLEAIRMLLGICLDSPSFPSAEDMLLYARCHPDCFCVCEDLPADHPEVAKMHTPLTAEQRQQMAGTSGAAGRVGQAHRRADRAEEARRQGAEAGALPRAYRTGRPPHRARGAARASPAKREQKKEARRDHRDRINRETAWTSGNTTTGKNKSAPAALTIIPPPSGEKLEPALAKAGEGSIRKSHLPTLLFVIPAKAGIQGTGEGWVRVGENPINPVHRC